MKAALLHGPKDFCIEEVAAPETGDDGVLVRIMTCGICPSDVRFYTGAREGATYPRMVGHEWVGEILEAGPSVGGFQVGDRVAAFVQRVCGMCRNCQRGLPNMCLNRLPAIRGGFCEVGWAVPEALVHIPEELPYEIAAFSEPLACCLNGIDLTPISAGDTVAIVGVGPIGQMLAQLARIRGARVLALDLDERRIDLAKKLGASEGLLASEPDVAEKVIELTGGDGADAVIVAVGSGKAEQMAFDLVGQGGCINYFAGSYPPVTIAVDPNVIHYKQLLVTGSYHFTPGGFRRAIDLLHRGVVQVQLLISHRLPLSRIAEGFDIVSSRSGMKVIIDLGGNA